MYSRFEHGERRPRREQVVKLARLLGTDVDEMVALWLAQEAHDVIATDRLAGRALQVLREMFGTGDNTPVEVASTAPEREPASRQVGAAMTVADDVPRTLIARVRGAGRAPYYVRGDAARVMNTMEDSSVDCIVTTPPYWSLREHGKEGISDMTPEAYSDMLLSMTAAARRVLKPSGSLWLNVADACVAGSLIGLPQRLVTRMVSEQGWLLRNEVVWRKGSGGDTAADHLQRSHEMLYHFTLSDEYYCDDDALRREYNERGTTTTGGSTRSGVTGSRYFQRIRQLTTLSDAEKVAAERALRDTIARVEAGEVNDYRMFFRGETVAVDNQSERARAIAKQGFYIMTNNRLGAAPPDVWTISPERSPIEKYNVAPNELYRWPVIMTCPPDGIVLDPYCGTGTACVVAYNVGRRAIGIDINEDYLRRARRRVEPQTLSLFD